MKFASAANLDRNSGERSGGTFAPTPQTKDPPASKALNMAFEKALRTHGWGLGLGRRRTADPSASLRFGANEQNGWGWICELTREALVWGKGAPQIPPLRYPEFLSKLMALANFMRLSLMKAAHVDLSDMAKQGFGYATVGMTNLLGDRPVSASMNKMAGAGFASSLVGPWFGGEAHRRSLHCATLSRKTFPRKSIHTEIPPLRCAPVGMTRGEGGASRERRLAEQKPFFISLGGPQAHENSGRDDKFVWGTGLKICLRDGLQASALRVHSSLNLPTGKSATRDDKFVWGERDGIAIANLDKTDLQSSLTGLGRLGSGVPRISSWDIFSQTCPN